MIRRFPLVTIAAATLALSLTASASMAGDGQLGQVAEELKAALAADPVKVTQEVGSITLTSSADAMFPSGGWQVPSSAPVLDKMLPTLSKLENTKIVVEGYTDNVPISEELKTKGVSNNLDLSAERAVSIANYLTAHGVKPDLISANAFGETNPVGSNDTPEGRAKNRRVAITLVSATPSGPRVGEAEAKKLLKAMSDYLAGLKAISFAYDTNLEVVTKEHQKLLFASSNKIEMSRPDKIRVTRHGGFADVELTFDGKTLTLLNKDNNLYAQVEVPGTIDHLIDELREKLHRPVPGADLLLTNVYDELMPEVVDAKDLGSGVIGGTECDHLAFRTKEVDWQIWIAQGEHPYPCRYVVTSNQEDQAPQYSVQISDWKTGAEVAAEDFGFKNSTDAKQVDDPKKLVNIDELPDQFAVGGTK